MTKATAETLASKYPEKFEQPYEDESGEIHIVAVMGNNYTLRDITSDQYDEILELIDRKILFELGYNPRDDKYFLIAKVHTTQWNPIDSIKTPTENKLSALAYAVEKIVEEL